jgi:hypothetical protein
MPRFVLLYHDCPPGYQRPSHWDLMLEDGHALATWALFALPRRWMAAHVRTMQEFPSCAPISESDSVAAERLAPHRASYLDFEGPVGSGRGHVVRVAEGKLRVFSRTETCVRFACDDGLPPGDILLQQTVDDGPWLLSCAS